MNDDALSDYIGEVRDALIHDGYIEEQEAFEHIVADRVRLAAQVATLEREVAAQRYRAEKHVQKWVESNAGKSEAQVATLTAALEEILNADWGDAGARDKIARAALEAASQQNGGIMDDTTVTPSLNGLEQAWIVIANVSEGDWTKQTLEWQEAARRWRDEVWHAALEAASQETTA